MLRMESSTIGEICYVAERRADTRAAALQGSQKLL